MITINDNDDTLITIQTFLDRAEDRTNYYLKFIESATVNSVILELPNLSTAPEYWSRFLVLENSGIPTGRGTMEFYASEQSGLAEMNPDDLINSQEYELKALSTFEIVQYYPEEIEYVYYKQL